MEQSRNPVSYDDDNIGLRELIMGLWAERLLIGVVTLAVGGLATGYALFATPYYEVQSILRPAVIKDLNEINSTGVYELNPQEVLNSVGAGLASYEYRLAFFQANADRFEALRDDDLTAEQTFAEFNEEAFEMVLPDPKEADANLTPFVGISVTYPADIDGVGVTNDFVSYVIEQERKKVEENFKVIVKNRLAVLERNIAGARAAYEADKESQIVKLQEDDELKRIELEDELAALRVELRTRRNDRITRLEEAIGIASSLGIKKPTNPTSLSEVNRPGQGSVIRTEVNNQDVPLYFMGTDALEAERATLLKRTSDDFTDERIVELQHRLQLLEQNRKVQILNLRQNEDLFLQSLAAWRQDEALLRHLNIDFSTLNLVKIDQVAMEPLEPVKPIKALVIAVGLVLGGMLGAFAALMRRMLSKPTVA